MAPEDSRHLTCASLTGISRRTSAVSDPGSLGRFLSADNRCGRTNPSVRLCWTGGQGVCRPFRHTCWRRPAASSDETQGWTGSATGAAVHTGSAQRTRLAGGCTGGAWRKLRRPGGQFNKTITGLVYFTTSTVFLYAKALYLNAKPWQYTVARLHLWHSYVTLWETLLNIFNIFNWTAKLQEIQ